MRSGARSHPTFECKAHANSSLHPCLGILLVLTLRGGPDLSKFLCTECKGARSIFLEVLEKYMVLTEIKGQDTLGNVLPGQGK